MYTYHYRRIKKSFHTEWLDDRKWSVKNNSDTCSWIKHNFVIMHKFMIMVIWRGRGGVPVCKLYDFNKHLIDMCVRIYKITFFAHSRSNELIWLSTWRPPIIPKLFCINKTAEAVSDFLYWCIATDLETWLFTSNALINPTGINKIPFDYNSVCSSEILFIVHR